MILEQDWENETGKGRKPRQIVLMSILLLWATVSKYHWGSLGDGIEHNSGFSHPRGRQAGVFIHQIPSAMVEGCSQRHQFHTLLSPCPHTSGLSCTWAEYVHAVRESVRESQVLAAREASLWGTLSALKWVRISQEVAGGCTNPFRIWRPCQLPVIPAAWSWYTDHLPCSSLCTQQNAGDTVRA